MICAVIVFFMFPKRDQELQLLAAYHAEDTKRPGVTPEPIKPVPDAEG